PRARSASPFSRATASWARSASASAGSARSLTRKRRSSSLPAGLSRGRSRLGAPDPMARWTFNEAHTAAEFSVRHMMITPVRGTFKNLQGTLEFDPDRPEDAWVETSIDASTLWSGEPERDDHLR